MEAKVGGQVRRKLVISGCSQKYCTALTEVGISRRGGGGGGGGRKQTGEM